MSWAEEKKKEAARSYAKSGEIAKERRNVKETQGNYNSEVKPEL